ncbi:hypothetical protein BO70DRAFT_338462 [Aspergillus heteromorphus CBS 117.55]|uniref:SNF2 family helicase n=1 Tax=Aspergillus heteromorphus CBS 117.55 TaxID=1448321 RepID=A0A317W031_9EURO|nr:uncharacterized protein BO70DRAFT_338462 [Aspergillus heteromorphus CBS 117.55]PWY79259.1 hypothetical protein BO70DRAFT_338462 [Aspergillus heteromorphus CBS 117.55]
MESPPDKEAQPPQPEGAAKGASAEPVQEAEILDVSMKLADSIRDRRQRSGAKGAFAMGRLGLRNDQLTQAERPVSDVDALPTGPAVVPLPSEEDHLFVPDKETQPVDLSATAETGFGNLTFDEFFKSLDGAIKDGDADATTSQIQGEREENTEPHLSGTDAQDSPSSSSVRIVASSSSSSSVHNESSSLNLENDTEEQGSQDEWPEEEIEAMAQAELSKAKFEDIERWFESLENPSIKDIVLYKAAKQIENARLRRVSIRKALGDQDDTAILDQLDKDPGQPSTSGKMPTKDEAGPSNGRTQTTRRTKARPNRVSADEKQKSMDIGLQIVLKDAAKKEDKKSGVKRKRGASGGDGYQCPRKKSKKKGMSDKEYLAHLLCPSVVGDAHGSAALREIPHLVKFDKEKALTDIVASIPAADKKEARSDKRKVLEATRKFSYGVKSDGKLGWKIKGLKTSLYHFQLIGAAWMRDRENATHPPHGGLFCDIMGFGKTIQSLANILDGKPTEPEDPVKTTLIVVPSHLVTHWKDQIIKHCEEQELGDVLVYKSSSRLETLDPVKSLEKYDIIITTYEEVRRSYPRCGFPAEVFDRQKIIDWWETRFDEEAGPLHQIKFLRIILDEGHLIKNHLSSVSIAVRGLTGRFKWVLSGTPIHNYLEEFYPHFLFLGVPCLGDFDYFTQTFCKDENAHGRLVNLLRSFLFRRTHQSRLFSLPVIKLPDVKERIVRVDFCEVEQEIYNAIEEVYIENINRKAHVEQPKLDQYRCFLAMILHLRMFCSHLLTTQVIVKRLLSDGHLMTVLVRLAKRAVNQEHPSFKIVRWLISVRMNTTVLTSEDSNKAPSLYTEALHGDRAKLTESYYKFMCDLHEDGQWDERLERASCPKCNFVPVNAVITSCQHMYCEECYYSLLDDDMTSADGKPICVHCSNVIEEAAYEALKEIELDPPEKEEPQQKKTKKQLQRKKKATKKMPRGKYYHVAMPGPADEEDDKPDADEETDWIPVCAEHMPSAKLTKTCEIISEWLAGDPSVKVVVFTQFLDCVRILSIMYQAQGWECRCLTGKMRMAAREESMEEFRAKDGNVKVLIASLRAGGIGLDLSAANKCILVDLWWNEAIQEQAFCRLFRIGQESKVEFVKILVNNTIDENLHELQTKKTAEITGTIGEDVLKGRETIENLLEMFAYVETDNRGAWHLTPKTRGSENGKKGFGYRSTFPGFF